MLRPRRARMLVDYEVQISLLRKIALHWVLLLAANTLGLFMWNCLLSLPIDSWSDFTVDFLRSYLPVLIISLALLPVFLLDAAKLSNRFAGPMVRIRRALAAVVAGENATPVKFRENDFWRSLADDFNQALVTSGRQTSAALPSGEATEPNEVLR